MRTSDIFANDVLNANRNAVPLSVLFREDHTIRHQVDTPDQMLGRDAEVGREASGDASALNVVVGADGIMLSRVSRSYRGRGGGYDHSDSDLQTHRHFDKPDLKKYTLPQNNVAPTNVVARGKHHIDLNKYTNQINSNANHNDGERKDRLQISTPNRTNNSTDFAAETNSNKIEHGTSVIPDSEQKTPQEVAERSSPELTRPIVKHALGRMSDFDRIQDASYRRSVSSLNEKHQV